MSRLISSILLGWALFLAPALCLGGLVGHPCDCGDESEIQCQHESECSDDPCGSLARPQDVAAQTQVDVDDVALIPVDWIQSLGLGMEGSPECGTRPFLSRPPDRPHLPYAECDRPLRI